MPELTLRILVVDDHEDSVRMLSRILGWEGHQVIAVSSTADAERLVLSDAVDLLISDIRLRDGCGWRLMETLKQARPTIAGIAVSGLAREADIRRSKEAGFIAHLPKPLDVDELRRVVERYAANLMH